jgi:hypothetical protein
MSGTEIPVIDPEKLGLFVPISVGETRWLPDPSGASCPIIAGPATKTTGAPAKHCACLYLAQFIFVGGLVDLQETPLPPSLSHYLPQSP